MFREEGVDLARVIIGHAGDSTDLDYLCTLMDNGSTIGMDRFDDVLPALRERGVEEAQIRQMFVGNPRRIFEHGGPY